MAIVDTVPFPVRDPRAAELQRVLAEMYGTYPQALSLAGAFGVPLNDVRLNLTPMQRWGELLGMLAVRGKVRALVEAVRKQHPNDRNLPLFNALLAEPGGKVQIYVSYSRKDRKLVDEFRLFVREASLPVRVFYDLDIAPGQVFSEELRRELDRSQLVLFFLSSDALSSAYIWEAEVPAAIALNEQGRARVVPVLLRPCDWTKTALAKYHLLPRGARPIVGTRPRSRAWTAVVEELRPLIAEILVEQARPGGTPRLMPAGPDRLRLALYAVLDQPAELELLDRLDERELAALWQRLSADGRSMAEVLQALAQRHGEQAPQPLWAAWIETVQPDKLGT
ncbi:toll/interleukin-1 receptor domain-containing protein [Bradyrhizobium liaoningense]|uniref:toll/interleukin-1 receptor domain-containing protein n=1 Tax=Bradyrhizobium liaoningense TaxID=43992 RepID=UPI001BA4510B|nr:toll/interleukin-1 receptor domain-containing protein [Bradyrhizobium liaoningense]MBR0941571.1 toll/interleukin-1 receptor domain-containing protein [Bradyrhizobium liaoningense]